MKSVMRQMIRNASTIVIILLLVMGVFIALGAALDIDLMSEQIQVMSLFIVIGSLIIYVMRMTDGRGSGKNEESFIKAENAYQTSVKGVDAKTLDKYFEYERKRRRENFEDYVVEMSGLAKKDIYELRRKEIRKKVSYKYWHLVWRCRAKRYPKLPFTDARQLKGLQSSIMRQGCGEYGVNAGRNFSRLSLFVKSLQVIVWAFFGANIVLAVGSSGWLDVVFAAIVMIFAFLTSYVGGNNTGYKEITVFMAGTYNTATTLLAECEAFAKERGLLYRLENTEPAPPIDFEKLKEEIKTAVLNEIDPIEDDEVIKIIEEKGVAV